MLLIASLLVWAMIYAVPGGPVAVIVGENATQEQIEAATEQFGLDRPVLVQYASWLKNALVGDLGALDPQPRARPRPDRAAAAGDAAARRRRDPRRSPARRARSPWSSALSPGSWLDRVLSGWSALALGVPTFWLGILLILLFAVELRWLPSASGYVPFWESPARRCCATSSCRR